MEYTLVTGGSSGIGKSLATECARRGMNLVLVALPGPELEQTAKDLTNRFSIDVRTLAINLNEPDAPRKVYDWCCEKNLSINFLINNAGLAGTTVFDQSDPDYSDSRILLNIRALTLITRYFVPMLKKHNHSIILNIASLSAFFPIPFKSVYSATKSYVVSFSRSLGLELKRFGIQVSVLCPNGVETNVGTYTRIHAHKQWGEWTKINSDRLAMLTIRKVLKGKKVIVPLFINRLLLFISRLMPMSLLLLLLEYEFNKEVRVS